MTNQENIDDSDLDDMLDNVLDDFNNLSTNDSKKMSKPDGVEQKDEPTQAPEESLDDLLDNEELTKQLAAGMEELMGEMGTDDMKDAFEKIWKSLDPNMSADESGLPSETFPKDTASSKPPQAFQDTIAQTMSKLKDSSKQVDETITDGDQDMFMAELMKQMEGLTDSGDFENVMEGMMKQLMSKEILYEPMKELVGKYPTWLSENKDKVEPSEYERYNKQFEYCKNIVDKYEDPTFDEKNEAQAKEIVDLMTKMQDFGQPPQSLLGEMAPGVDFNGGPDGLPDMKDLENCSIM